MTCVTEQEGDRGLTRDERLKRSSDFRRAIRRGSRARGRYVKVYLFHNGLSVSRLGAGSTKRLGPAVERNRAKRLVREAFRLCKDRLPGATDIVVLPRIPWREPSLSDLTADIEAAARRAAAGAERK
jgi:ribonuclease P protein component